MLVGLIDDNNNSILWDDIKKGLGSFSDPLPVLLSLYPDRDKYCDFSITELLDCPLHRQLIERIDYFESPDNMMDRILGTAIHAVFEATSNKFKLGQSENKVSYKVGDSIVGGTIDLINDSTMWDYKTLTMGKLKMLSKGKADKSKYEQQLNLYKLMYTKLNPDHPITDLKISFVVRDWRSYEARRTGFNKRLYPRKIVLPIEIWSEKTAIDYLESRVKLHKHARSLHIDDLSSLGICDTWGGIRCREYCPVSHECDFNLLNL